MARLQMETTLAVLGDGYRSPYAGKRGRRLIAGIESQPVPLSIARPIPVDLDAGSPPQQQRQCFYTYGGSATARLGTGGPNLSVSARPTTNTPARRAGDAVHLTARSPMAYINCRRRADLR